MKKLYFIIVLVINYYSAFPQIYIQGIIKENIYEVPIEGVQIYYNNEKYFSDSEGKFNIKIKSFPSTLFFSSPVYYEKNLEINNEKNLEIFLTNKGLLLEEIIVKSEINKKKLKYASSSISLIKNIQSKKSSDLSIESGLNEIPGVYMHSGALNTNRITIRGMGSRSPYSTNKIKSYLNNIPLSNGVGETSIEDLGIDLFDQIEIIKGPNSNIYGAGLGGAILFNLDKSKEHNLSYSSFFGSYETIKNQINIYKKFNKIEGQINFQNLSSNGYRENNNYLRYNAFGYLGYNINQYIKLDLIYNYINLRAEIPSSLNIDDFSSSPFKAAESWKNINGNEKYNKELVAISFNYNLNSYNLNANIFYNNYNSDEKRPFNYLTENSNGYGTRIVNTIKRNNHKINFGLEFYRENYLWKTFKNYDSDIETQLADQNEKRNNLLIFTKYEILLNTTTNIDLGISSNYIKYKWETLEYNNLDPQTLKNKDSKIYDYKNIISPKIAINKILFDKNIFFTISHGYSPPNIDETLDEKGFVNPNIKPETGWNFELGSRGNLLKNKISYDMSVYLMKIKNLLVAQRTAEDTFVGVNAGKTSHPGIEITINSKLWSSVKKQNNIKSEIYFSKTWYEFIEFVDKDTDYSGKTVTGVPSYKIANILMINMNNFKTIIDFQNTGKIPMNDSNEKFSDPYTIINLKISKLFQINKIDIRITTGIKNLLNEKYASMILINAQGFNGNIPRYYYPGLPRNYFISLNLKI